MTAECVGWLERKRYPSTSEDDGFRKRLYPSYTFAAIIVAVAKWDSGFAMRRARIDLV
jgi:hypothetical protein